MRKQNKRLIAVLCLLAVILSLSACGSNPVSVLDNGEEKFANGKTEEDYSLPDSGKLLDELIEKYSGSLYVPSDTELSDEEYEEHYASIPEPTPPPDDTTEPQPTPVPVQLPEISNDEQLAGLIAQTWKNLETDVHFKLSGGYVLDIHNKIFTLCNLVEDIDPIAGNSVEMWYSWSNGDEGFLSFEYKFPIDEVSRMNTQAEAKAAEVANRLNSPGMNDYERICAVNEYLCNTVYYPPNEPYAPVTHTAYGALIDGCAVCEGYSCAAAAILRKMGVECRIVWGPCLDGGDHAWNLVLLEGNWYQMDVTWNDGSNVHDMYLLETDSFMKQSRTWNYALFPASASRRYRP